MIWACVLMVQAAVPSVQAILVDDLEPNDTLAMAVATGVTDYGTATVSGGEIGNGPLGDGDRDFFSIEVSPEADLPLLLTVTMHAVNEELDGYLRVFDQQGSQIAFQDDALPENGDPLLHTYLLEPGAYFVGVSHALNPGYHAADDTTGRAADTGEYDLEITLSPPPTMDSTLEPNDTEPVVVELLPYSVSDQFIGDGPNLRLDVDRYLVTPDGPSILTVEASPSQLGGLEPILSVEINGASFAVHETEQADSRTQRLELAVFDAGPLEVIIEGTASPPEEPDWQFGSVGFYDLTIDLTAVTQLAAGPYEPNDSLLEALPSGVVGPGSATLQAFIGDGDFGEFRGDIDLFTVSMTLNDTLDVVVSPTGGRGGLAPVVHLYDFYGMDLGTWAADESGAAHATFTPFAAGISAPDDEPREYIVGIMGTGDRPTADPFIPNPFDPEGMPPLALRRIDGGPGSTGGYEVTFEVTPFPSPRPAPHDSDGESDGIGPLARGSDGGPTPAGGPGRAALRSDPTAAGARRTAAAGEQSGRLFATLLDYLASSIVELDVLTGEIVGAFRAPEAPLGGAEGLGYDGENLFFLGRSGRYPALYRVNPDTGEILERTNTWFGSGYYGDMAYLAGNLYIVDVLYGAVFRLPTAVDGPAVRLDSPALNSLSPFGPIAAVGVSGGLLVSEMSDPQVLYLVAAEDGSGIATFPARGHCVCDADFDGDGDVDNDDRAFLEMCDYRGYGSPCSYSITGPCLATDLNCDAALCPDDYDIFDCQANGPGVPPNSDCCPDNEAGPAARATTLASTGGDYLVSGNWLVPLLNRFDLTGSAPQTVVLDAPVGALAGEPLVAATGDGDDDGNVDLIDWGLLQTCFPRWQSHPIDDACRAFDFDFDGDVDLFDADTLQSILAGAGP